MLHNTLYNTHNSINNTRLHDTSILISLRCSLTFAKPEALQMNELLFAQISFFIRHEVVVHEYHNCHNASRAITQVFSFHSTTIQTPWYLLQLERTKCLRVLCERPLRERRTAKETFLLPGAIPSQGILLTADETDSADKSWRAILFGRYIERDGARNTEPRNCTDLHSECTRTMRSLTAIVVSPARAIVFEKRKKEREKAEANQRARRHASSLNFNLFSFITLDSKSFGIYWFSVPSLYPTLGKKRWLSNWLWGPRLVITLFGLVVISP